ncbi:hypothetical protein [Streptomyces ureilyticus]|uniref:hypothetical protein n=1 Tax=Streptomyces ureilyticus TaxID=1775131 RepID=UPI001F295997|nr:hypothetical protein [Streptomyces ureilyticus]
MADRSTSLTPPGEKVDFDNEVDFFGDPVLDLEQFGFDVFQTLENVGYGGAENMPNIRFEIDANLNTLPTTDDYTTMVWVPDAIPTADLNPWSPFIDATDTGYWYFTGAEGPATDCTQAMKCTFAEAKSALDDGSDAPIVYTAAVGKGRDYTWIHAVDNFQSNRESVTLRQTA